MPNRLTAYLYHLKCSKSLVIRHSPLATRHSPLATNYALPPPLPSCSPHARQSAPGGFTLLCELYFAAAEVEADGEPL